MENAERPKVGIGVIVERNGKILVGKRNGGHGAGTYEIPGGYLEFGESFEDAAKREVEEETGLTNLAVKDVVSIGNDVAYEKHYVSIGILTESLEGEPQTMLPDKCSNWEWYDPANLPDNIFPHSLKVIRNWLAGTVYSGK